MRVLTLPRLFAMSRTATLGTTFWHQPQYTEMEGRSWLQRIHLRVLSFSHFSALQVEIMKNGLRLFQSSGVAEDWLVCRPEEVG